MTRQLTATHPVADVTLTYDPASWTYADSTGARYLFATRFASRFFPAFDAPAAAARKSAKTGIPAAQYLAEWKAKSKASRRFGDHVHAHAAASIESEPGPAPETEMESLAFSAVDKALNMLAGGYEILGAEQLIFDPAWLLAGYLDIAARNRETGALTVIDWKTCEDISDDSWGRFALPPIAHIPDHKLAHYGLDQSVYGYILDDSGYLDAGQKLELALIHIAPGIPTPQWIELPYLHDEVAACVAAWRATDEFYALGQGRVELGTAAAVTGSDPEAEA